MSEPIRIYLGILLLVAWTTVLTGCDAFEPPDVEPASVPDASLEVLEESVEDKLNSIQERAIPDAGSTQSD